MMPALPVSRPHAAVSAPAPASVRGDVPTAAMSDNQLLDDVEREAVRYFWDNASPDTGLVLDRANNFKDPDLGYSASSIAATGFGLSALVVAARHGWLPQDQVQNRIRTTLQTFEKMPNVHGFYYHFVDPKTGQRMWNSELSPIDTTLFLTGALTAAQAYPGTDIEKMAKDLYAKVDWPWMLDGGTTLRMGWTPEHGFIPSRWDHYDESSVMYVLGIGSPTHALPPSTWRNIERHLVTADGQTFLESPCLFTHQYSQLYMDLRGKTDGQLDYFASSRNATLANREYCIDHANQHAGYGPDSWGITASDGPNGYVAYGVPPGDTEDDGTIAPTGAVGSYEFTPNLSMQALRHMAVDLGPSLWGRYGLSDAYNIDKPWFDQDVLGIDQGAELLSIENARTGMVWRLFGENPEVRQALHAIGFHRGEAPPGN